MKALLSYVPEVSRRAWSTTQIASQPQDVRSAVYRNAELTPGWAQRTYREKVELLASNAAHARSLRRRATYGLCAWRKS